MARKKLASTIKWLPSLKTYQLMSDSFTETLLKCQLSLLGSVDGT